MSTTHAQNAPTQADFGGVGLWQTPTARMAEEGELAFTASHAQPYDRYNFSLQPLPWLEGIFRYTAVSNRLYGPDSLSGSQSYKDKSIDVKVRLWTESRYLPDLSVGARDIGGTGLFSGEYVVINKRFGAFDASLGMGWGYVGGRGDISNPLSVLSDKFDTRPDGSSGTGKLSTNHYFRGPAALFGGISYQTPWDWLVLKAEYDGNDYQHEPQHNNQKQSSPVNVGAVIRPSRNLDLSLALERGNTVVFGLSFHANMATSAAPPKLLDPPLPKRNAQAVTTTPEQVDWAKVSAALHDNAGIQVSSITRRGSEIVVSGEQDRYFYSAKAVGRAARVLDNQLGPSIDWYTVVSQQEGLSTVETSVHRQRFDELVDHDIDLSQFRRSVEQNAPTPRREQVLYSVPVHRWDQSFSFAYGQSLGGPDAFLLYQIAAVYDVDFHFTPNFWWSGAASLNLINNYDKFTYDAPSELPRVRTDVRQYMTSSNLTMPIFQLTGTRQLGNDLYGMAYAGMLESMFGGVGGEMLYRPFGQRWAIGTEIDWVKQRGYDQDFSFRDYHIVTGFVTGYFDLGYKDVLVAVSAGRYLAGDWGATLDVSREFRNGVRMGAYATKTNVSAQQFGEGSFDKGIYVSIPFDLMLPRSTLNRATFVWDPLIRDGGARLGRRYGLYSLTSDRDFDNFNGNLDKIVE
ncbi:MAG TPA: YjbH domain-containing protein [Dyella sp.]|uniref:YjbH domain-containing protein n=1 Tax=Dyella sp. TaxID=1869338 RepID=UPI002D78B4BB|nr:YjbH domain-containing protein [Dyella sp.]HET6552138.1 YjbH domain-containing protein [Dyella sp.]